MEVSRPAALTGGTAEPAQLAKAALRRLAHDKLEPTPENYARAWRQEAGLLTADDGVAIAQLIERIVSEARDIVGRRLSGIVAG